MYAIASLFSNIHPHRPIHKIKRSSKLQSCIRVSMRDQQVEVKIKLQDSNSHKKLTFLLSPFLITTQVQENLFFDSSDNDLAAHHSALNLRLYDSDVEVGNQAFFSLKSRPSISSGICCCLGLQFAVDPLVARSCIADPSLLGHLDDPVRSNPVIQRVTEIVGYNSGFDDWVCLGGFRNVRKVYNWKELKLEVDETQFDFGTNYEIECESETPIEAKSLIEEFLIENGIPFSYSKASKFTVFRDGKLPL